MVKVHSIETLQAYAGWRTHSYLKLTLDSGVVGWSEFSQAFGGPGAVDAIEALSPSIVGRAPTEASISSALLQAGRKGTVGQQAAGAIQNALLDARARSLDVPVHELLGGKVRDRVPVYWAHCGTYRVSHAELMNKPPIRSLDDVVALGREVAERGYGALKTNILLFDGGRARRYSAGVDSRATWQLLHAAREQLAAFREGAGEDIELLLDVGANLKTDGALRLARGLEEFDLTWLELETRDAQALAQLRTQSPVAVAGGESLRRREYRPFLETAAADVLIVDVLFNGVAEALHVAAMCDAFDTNVAVHNCYGPLATMIAATFSALAPNLALMETDVDAVPWNSDFVTVQPTVQDGFLTVADGPGWGTEVNEAEVRRHPLPPAA